jgi:hypothetical protein
MLYANKWNNSIQITLFHKLNLQIFIRDIALTCTIWSGMTHHMASIKINLKTLIL